MKAISKKQPLINSSQRLKSLYLLQGNFIINSSAKNFYDDVSFEKRKKSLETLEALNNRYSDYMNKIHKYMDVINFNNSNNIRKRYFNSYYSKYGQDIDEKLNFKGEPQLVVPDSVLYNKDKHKLPKLYTTNPPESEESFKSKFKANTNIQTGFKPNPDKIDSYYIIGTEIFKNLRKEHIKNKEFDQPEFDYYVNAINNNIDIKELRTDKTEEFFPLKDDLEVSPIEEESKYIHPNLYFEVEEKNKHLFGPDLENGKEYINPYLTTKKDYYMGCRKKHNSRLFQLLSQVSTIFNRNWDQYTNFNPKLLEIINTLSQMKSNTSDFTFSNDEFTRAVETGDFHEIKSLFTPEEILLIKHNLTEMKGLVSNISLNEISDFVMSMFFIANINFKSLWVILEEKILNGIHHLKHTDLCKLLMVSSMSSPKYFTKRLRDNLIAEMIKDKSPSVLIETLIATRFKQDAKLFDSLSEYAIKNHKNWVLKELSAKRKAENLVVPLLFALSFGKPPRPKVEFKYEVQVDFDEKFSDFSDTIIELTPLFSKEQTLLTLNSLALTGIDEVELLVYQLQKNLMGLKLNPKEIAWVCESLNQMRKGKMSGTEELVLHLLKGVEDKYSQLELDEFLEVLYLAGSRRLILDKNGKTSPSRQLQVTNLIKGLEDHLKSVLDQVNSFKQVFLIVSYLTFVQSTDKNLIQKVLDLDTKLTGSKLSSKYYKGFKYFDYYLRTYLNYTYEQVTFRKYFYFPEQVFNITIKANEFRKRTKLNTVYHTLTSRLGFPVTIANPYQNTFFVPLSIETRKIAIFLYLEEDYLPNSKKLHPFKLLEPEIFRKDTNWEVISFTWDEYINMGDLVERESKFKKLIEDCTIRSQEKGFFKINARYL